MLTKLVLGMDIHDPEREEDIRQKIREIANQEEINKDSLSQIIMILVELSKEEQEKILRR